MSQLEKDVLFVAEWAARADLLFPSVAQDLHDANDQRVWEGFEQRWTATLRNSLGVASVLADWYQENLRILEEILSNTNSDQDRLDAIEKIKPILGKGDGGSGQATRNFLDLKREIIGFKDYAKTQVLAEILVSFAEIWSLISKENQTFQIILENVVNSLTIPRFKAELKLAQPIGASLLSVLVKYLSLLLNRK